MPSKQAKAKKRHRVFTTLQFPGLEISLSNGSKGAKKALKDQEIFPQGLRGAVHNAAFSSDPFPLSLQGHHLLTVAVGSPQSTERFPHRQIFLPTKTLTCSYDPFGCKTVEQETGFTSGYFKIPAKGKR